MRVSRAMWVALVCMLLLALVGGAVHWSLPKHNVQSNDIYFSYVEGGRLLAGENPYGRVAAGNMRDDQKYATYVPGFYLLSAITRKLGLEDYLQWITFWRWVWLGFNLGSACVILPTCLPFPSSVTSTCPFPTCLMTTSHSSLIFTR